MTTVECGWLIGMQVEADGSICEDQVNDAQRHMCLIEVNETGPSTDITSGNFYLFNDSIKEHTTMLTSQVVHDK